jgi:hypothetical protein
MITVKGFLTSPQTYDNNDNQTAVFGELTQYSSTFAKDYKTYTSSDGKYQFCVFSSINGMNKAPTRIDHMPLVHEIGAWCYDQGTVTNPTVTKQQFAQQMLNRFGGQIQNTLCDDLIADNLRRMPRWISFDIVENQDTYQYRVWLATEDFQNSYDEFEIQVVPPVPNVDLLFQPYADLLTELRRNDMAVIHERMNAIRGRFPETLVRTVIIELIDKTNPQNRSQIPWTVLIYGPYGDSVDNIKDAIRKYIFDYSSNTESDWRILMPDLFNSTCFYIIPRWDKYAIQPRMSMPGLYSPVVNSVENFAFVKDKTQNYIPSQHLTDNLEVTAHRYKDIALNIIGSDFNRLNLFKFTDYFKDYLIEAPKDEDFNRQDTATKDINNLFTNMLKTIDNYNINSTLPQTMRIVNKHGQNFVVALYSNVEYYMLMKPEHQ